MAKKKVSLEPYSMSSVKVKPSVPKKKIAKVVKNSTRKVTRRGRLDESVPLERSNLRVYKGSMILAAVILTTTLGVFYAKGRIAEDQNAEKVEEEIVEVEVAEVIQIAPSDGVSEDEVVVLDREDITLEILNGSGVSGTAGDTQTEFEDLGYVVDEIGNADETEKSELYISNEYSEEELENLIKDVKRRLDIEKVSGSIKSLDTTARIILGSE